MALSIVQKGRASLVILQDTITVDAPASEVWAFLLDVERSSTLVPGVEQITMVDDRTFDGVIEARVGPIAGKFNFRAHIVDSQPPTELVAEVEGTDSVTKSTLRMDVTMNLKPLSPTSTEMAHRAVVDVKGRLAILGDMVLRATASLILDEFAKRLRTQLQEG
jgi:carbon monoxide dehydrogenase subunit G